MSRFANVVVLLSLCLAAGGLSGCATQVHEDYGRYLANNQGKAAYTPVSDSIQYYLDQRTQNHSEEIRSFMVGVANSWTVRFGDVLDATMQARDMQNAFGRATKVASPDGSQGLVLAFSLVRYDFSGFQASIELNTTVRHDGQQILEKTYSTNGISQGGKMFWGGAFAMKNAVQQSTKDAVDKIFANLIGDIKIALATPRSAAIPAKTSWDGEWYAKSGPYQVYLEIQNGNVRGRIRTASDNVFDIAGSVGSMGLLHAGFSGEPQAHPLELRGTMPALALYNDHEFTGEVRMDRRK